MGDGAFKHITVTAAEEEDVIIHAGLAPSDAVKTESSAPESLAAEDSAGETSMSEELAVQGTASEDPTTNNMTTESAPAIDAPSKKVPAETRTHKVRDDGYRPTTLEDLQGKPMPTVQKAVIIAAIICIIGAIVYYIAFMR